MNKIILSLLTAAIFLTGCEKDFLDVKQPGVVTISTTQDYDLLLNADNVTTFAAWPLMHLSDNLEFPPDDAPQGANLLIYTWQNQPYQEEDPVLWSSPYKSIYYSNLVINEVDQSEGGTKADKDKLKGEAYLNRAYMHFVLGQIYAKAYNATTANTDPGIPYVTIADMYAKAPERGTVKQTYDKIIADLNSALPLLPATNAANFRGSKAAAYGLLARVYLHLKEYDKVITNADAMLALNSTVLDYSPANFTPPAEVNNSEYVYLRMVFEFDHPFGAFLTPDAADLLPATDSRRRVSTGFANMFSKFGISVPEILLTKAEALVRKSIPDPGSALTIVNNLHAKRDRVHTDLTSTDQEQVLNWVLDEKRRELVGSGLRWFDMRRLAPEGKTPTVTRQVGADTYTLAPDSKKYTLQIPGSVINFNPDMQQNDR